MYDLALSVTACLRAGTRVDIAWLVDVQGFAYPARPDALMFTPGGGRIGSILGGAGDEQLAGLADARSASSPGRLVELQITDYEAMLGGLSGTGTARCVLTSATLLPDELWPVLLARDPVGLVTEVDERGWTGASTVVTPGAPMSDVLAQLFGRAATGGVVEASEVITVLWPVPRLVIVGGGPIVEALEATARLLDWSPVRITQVDDVRRIGGLGPSDGIVIAAHDLEFAGAALAEALGGDAGYIGSLGGRPMQRARGEWLAERGIDPGNRIHGPAGLDIGARKPGEVAIAIVAEMLASRPK